MQIILFGATGYIGSHVAEQLIKAGHQPLCLVRKNAQLAFLQSLHANILHIDFNRQESLASVINKQSIVINCIADTRSHASLEQKQAIDIDLPLALFTLCQVNRAQRFMQLSSVMAYGFDRPAHAINEGFPSKGRHSYNQVASKRDQILIEQWQPNSTELLILRPSNALGKRDTAFLPNFISASKFKVFPVVDDGLWQFSCIDARDIGRAMAHLLTVPALQPEVFLNKGYDCSWLDLKAALEAKQGKKLFLLKLPKPFMKFIAKLLQTITPLGKQPPLTEFDLDVISSHTLFDDSKLRGTGFMPKYHLADSLNDALKPSPKRK